LIDQARLLMAEQYSKRARQAAMEGNHELAEELRQKMMKVYDELEAKLPPIKNDANSE